MTCSTCQNSFYNASGGRTSSVQALSETEGRSNIDIASRSDNLNTYIHHVCQQCKKEICNDCVIRCIDCFSANCKYCMAICDSCLNLYCINCLDNDNLCEYCIFYG